MIQQMKNGMLQQYLPLAVLKLHNTKPPHIKLKVATVLTACGIETATYCINTITRCKVATVLTACGIETHNLPSQQTS